MLIIPSYPRYLKESLIDKRNRWLYGAHVAFSEASLNYLHKGNKRQIDDFKAEVTAYGIQLHSNSGVGKLGNTDLALMQVGEEVYKGGPHLLKSARGYDQGDVND